MINLPFKELLLKQRAAIVAVAALGLLCLSASLYVQAVALAALLMSLPPLLTLGTSKWIARFGPLPPASSETIFKYLPYAVVTAGALVALGPVSLGQMPVSQDHANHYFATHVLVHELIPSGRFFGWTDQYSTGYPYGDTYHTASYLVTGLVHLLTFGLISLQKSYAFGIVLAWLVPALAVTAWSRRVAGPGGASLAGLAYVLDMGSDREGGWIYAMFHGVWTQHFGTGVWLFALLALWRLCERLTTRRLSAAVLLSGLCMWIHPMTSLALPVGGLLLFIVRFLSEWRTAPLTDKVATLHLVPALFLAGLLGLTWVLRMMLAGDMVFASVAYGDPLYQLMKQLLLGVFMDNTLAIVSVLGLVGVIIVAIKGGGFRLYTLALMLPFLLLGSMSLLLESDLGLAGGTLGIMQYRRFSIAAKPLWYVMSAVGFSTSGAMFLAAAKARVKGGPALRFFVAVAAAPFLIAGWQALPSIFRSPVARPLTFAATGDAENLNRIFEVLARESKRCPDNLCRAVYFEKPGHGGLYPVIAMADTGFAWQPTLTLPANNFKWINQTANIDIMARRGVSVIISKWPLEDKRLEHLGQYGRHHLYRINGARAIRAELDGPGSVEIAGWQPERRVMRLSGTSDESRLIVYQPPYGKWHAEQGGRALPIALQSQHHQMLTRIDGVQDGELVLTFDDTLAENLAAGLGAILILGCAAGLFLRPRPLPHIISDTRMAALHTILGFGSLGLVALLAAGAIIGGRVAADMTWLSGESTGAKLLTVLHQRHPDKLSFTPERYCVPAYVRNPEFGCSEHDLLPRLTPAEKRGGSIPSCLSVGIPPKGKTTLTYDLPSGTTHIKGRLHQQEGGAVKGAINGTPLKKASAIGAPFTIPVAPNSDTVVIQLTAKETARACIEAVAIQEP